MHDGFEGNAQTFRVLTKLAVRSNANPGLNLTRRTLGGVIKYPWLRDRHYEGGKRKLREWGAYRTDRAVFEAVQGNSIEETLSLEAEIMEWADDVTFSVHDMDDFFRAGLIPLDRLGSSEDSERKRFRELLIAAKEAKPIAFPSYEPDELVGAVERLLVFRGPTEPYRHLVDRRAGMGASGSKLVTSYLNAFMLDDAQTGGVALKIDREQHCEMTALKMLTVVYVIRDPALGAAQHGQKLVIGDLYNWYLHAADHRHTWVLLPPGCRDQLSRDSEPEAKSRVIVDFIAGLTEHAALTLHQRLHGGAHGSILDATARMG